MSLQSNFSPSSFRALLLFVYSLGNYVLLYFANVVLARKLTLNEFDDYSVAISVVTLLSTIATLGLEKYALRAIALFRERQDWPKLNGFLLFSRSIIAGFGFILFVVLAVGLELILAWRGADYHFAIVLYAMFLPVISLALYFVEVISALGKQELAFIVYRLFLPLLFLAFVLYLNNYTAALTAISAVVSFGLAWGTVLGVLWGVVNVWLLRHVNQYRPVITAQKWIQRSIPLVVSSLLMTIMTNSGVIILELLFTSGIEVGIYAIAAQTGSILNLIGTSTNRYYLPKMVLFLEQNDNHGLFKLFQQRSLLIGPFILFLFIMIAVFGHDILSLFGDKFSEAYPTLIVISAGACFSALFADVPYYLQYIGLNRLVVGNAAIAVVVMVVLAFWLGGKFGAIGVACAYTLPVSFLFLSYRWALSNHIKIP